MVKVTLDAETFKALASATRLTVLRALDERRKTLTELSRELELNKATVHEHLALLTAADLVKKRDDEGRKWVYYELTWRGQKILHPQETTTFNVLLGLGVAAAGGGTFMLLRALQDVADKSLQPEAGDGQRTLGAEAPQDTQAASAPAEGGEGSGEPPSQHDAADADPMFDMQEGAAKDGVASDGDAGFFDQGGWVAVALFACALLFAVLAVVLRRKLRGRPPKASALQEDAATRSVSQQP